LPEDPVSRVDHEGRTSRAIARDVLRAAGVDNRDLDGTLERWCRAFEDRYLELLEQASTSEWASPPGTAEALEQLQRLGVRTTLLTGNPEQVARARMERLGLARFFSSGQGAFGCESDLRLELLRTARRRAGSNGQPWPAKRTVEIGDTPLDVSSAREAGIRSIGFRSARCDPDRLNGADAVVDTMPELVEALTRL
jgi:phosphoglycolate phosphatase